MSIRGKPRNIWFCPSLHLQNASLDPVAEHALSTEVIEALFNVSPSATDESSRNQVRFGDTFYAVVFRRL